MRYLIGMVIFIYMFVTLCKKTYFYYQLKYIKQEIQKRYDQLISILTQQHHTNHYVQRLINKRQSNNIVLVTDPSKQGFGYNINKGEEIGVCMINYKTGSVNKLDDIFYVLLHELAHVMTFSYSHDTEFHSNFHFLQQVAIENNIFTLTDYKSNPSEFCNGYINGDI